MVPESRRERGAEMPLGGTACGEECVCCGKRYSNRYYFGAVRMGATTPSMMTSGPYCGPCADREYPR